MKKVPKHNGKIPLSMVKNARKKAVSKRWTSMAKSRVKGYYKKVKGRKTKVKVRGYTRKK